MAVKNSFSVYIDGINRTSKAVMPLKWANFLDERLDECYLSLRTVDESSFSPLTPVEIRLSSMIYFGEGGGTEAEPNAEARTWYYLIANDTANEAQIGRGYFDHELYLIEVTKYLECLVVDTITFTNDIGRTYILEGISGQSLYEVAHSVADPWQSPDGSLTKIYIGDAYYDHAYTDNQVPVPPPSYANATVSPQTFTFVSPYTIFPYDSDPTKSGTWKNLYTRRVYDNEEIINESTLRIQFYQDNFDRARSEYGDKSDFVKVLEIGHVYRVVYEYTGPGETHTGYSRYHKNTVEYTFTVVENLLPMKEWTIKDVINRTLALAEPLRQGETPRIKLNAEQATLFDNILAPQFSFTKQTLRECLQEIGKVLHGEPRLSVIREGGGYFYELSYDMYGDMEMSNLARRKYSLKQVSHAVESFATSLDSNVENLVNSLDKYSGVIVEPYSGDNGFKSVRTEQQYIRITEKNMIIATQYPIYTVEKLECLTPDGNVIDITPYVFEKSVYNTRLSSYSSEYPYAKSHAVMYAQGEKNITALNFKSESASPVIEAYKNYSIINILRRSLNNSKYSVDAEGYPTLAFRVTYTPIYNARVAQTKPYYMENPRAAALIINQQANIAESRYYGENLKGMIARIGNMEQTITYLLPELSDIPRAGQRFDDDYYISAVSVEFLPTYIKCTVGLSKDFNRLSQYIGIPSERRYSEISQTQASERNVLYREYVVIGDRGAPENLLIGSSAEIAAEYEGYPFGGSVIKSVPTVLNIDGSLNLWGMCGGFEVLSEGGNEYYNATLRVRINLSTPLTYNSLEHDIVFYGDSLTSISLINAKGDKFGGSFASSDGEWMIDDGRTIIDGIIAIELYFGRGADMISTTTKLSMKRYIENPSTDSLIGDRLMEAIAATFSCAGTHYPYAPLTNVVAWGVSTHGNTTPAVILPVVSSAFGNSISFSWKYKDNFSAGATSQYGDYETDKEGNIVRGYFQNDRQYTDYYGRIYYYHFDLQAEGGGDANTRYSLPAGSPATRSSGYFSTVGKTPYILRKDNREALQVNVQIDFVTNRRDLIIGSALASYCGAVRGSDAETHPKLYVFDQPLNKFINHVEGTLSVKLSDLPSVSINGSDIVFESGRFSLKKAFPASGKAWAIVIAQTSTTVEVEDEEGTQTKQTKVKGGDVLLAQNMDVAQGEQLTLYFTKKRKIYDEAAWVDSK